VGWLNYKPRVLDVIEDSDRCFRLRVGEPSDWAWRLCFPLSLLIGAAVSGWTDSGGLGFSAGFALSLALGLPLSMRLPVFRRSYELVFDGEAGQVLKRTQSKVLPESTVAAFPDLQHVRVAHITSRDPAAAGGGAYGADALGTTPGRDAFCITYRRRDDHPDAGDALLVHSSRKGDAELLRLAAGRLSELAGVELLDELG
jgi:hypothetical protein